jgi:hypothetical protein
LTACSYSPCAAAGGALAEGAANAPRATGRRSHDENNFGHAEQMVAIKKLNTADVAFQVNGNGVDNDGFAGFETGAICRGGDHQTGFREAIIANKDGCGAMDGIDDKIETGRLERRWWTVRDFGNDGFQSFD